MIECDELGTYAAALTAGVERLNSDTCLFALPITGPDGHDITFYGHRDGDGWQLTDRGSLAFELGIFGVEQRALRERIRPISEGMPAITLVDNGELQVSLPPDLDSANRVLKRAAAAVIDGWALSRSSKPPSLVPSLSRHLVGIARRFDERIEV